MKVLFLTLVNITDVNERNLYTDLMRKFRDERHEVVIVTPVERRLKQKSSIVVQDGITLLKIKTLNVQKTNLLEKGVATLLLEHLFLNGIRKYLSKIKFDLLLYSTPPITFTKVIKYIKKRDHSFSYLLLKDIFPQNAVDIEMIKKDGFIHRYFRRKEKQLYRNSDVIGCMSSSNMEYIIWHNPELNPEKVEVNPNSIEPTDTFINREEKLQIRKQHNIPSEATVFIYGGNLGKPQGIDFLIEVLEVHKHKHNVFFMIVGSGTEYPKVHAWFEKTKPHNAKLIHFLSKEEYDKLLQASDVGLIFLDIRFTIPNFPSRLLSYLEFKMPVIAATDPNTDISRIMEENNFGLWCETGDIGKMNQYIETLHSNKNKIQKMGLVGYQYLIENYTVSTSYQKIINQFNYSLK